MTDYIPREALGIGKCNSDVFEDKGYAKGWNAAIDIIQNAPAADVRPVVRGKWGRKRYGPWASRLKCSKCEMLFDIATDSPSWNFCPNCGARMEES